MRRVHHYAPIVRSNLVGNSHKVDQEYRGFVLTRMTVEPRFSEIVIEAREPWDQLQFMIKFGATKDAIEKYLSKLWDEHNERRQEYQRAART